MEKQPCVYMLASARNGTLYVGVISNLTGFTKRCGVHNLAWANSIHK